MATGLALEVQDSGSDEIARREGETEGLFFRGDRFYSIDGRFFFSTREGIEVGPFGSRNDAEKGLQRFIDSIQANHTHFQAKSAAISGIWAVSNFQ